VRGAASNNRRKLTNGAEAPLAAHSELWADASGRRSAPFGWPRVTPFLRVRRLTGSRPLKGPAPGSRRIGAAAWGRRTPLGPEVDLSEVKRGTW